MSFFLIGLFIRRPTLHTQGALTKFGRCLQCFLLLTSVMVNKRTMENYPRLTSNTKAERQLSCFGRVKLKILKEEKITAIGMQRPNN